MCNTILELVRFLEFYSGIRIPIPRPTRIYSYAHSLRNNSQTKIAFVENAFFPLLVAFYMLKGTTTKYHFFFPEFELFPNANKKKKKKEKPEKTT